MNHEVIVIPDHELIQEVVQEVELNQDQEVKLEVIVVPDHEVEVIVDQDHIHHNQEVNQEVIVVQDQEVILLVEVIQALINYYCKFIKLLTFLIFNLIYYFIYFISFCCQISMFFFKIKCVIEKHF